MIHRMWILTLLLLIAPVGNANLLEADVGDLGLPTVPLPLEETTGTIDDVTGVVDGLLECQQVVRVDLRWWGGLILDETFYDDTWVTTRTYLEWVPRSVPIFDTVTETVVPSLGLLPPIVRQVERQVGVETILEEMEISMDYGVYLEWEEQDRLWEMNEETFLVELPVGLPLLSGVATEPEGFQRAMLTTYCGDQESILTYVPSPNWGAYDLYSSSPKVSGIHTHLVDYDVWFASAEDMAQLEQRQSYRGSFTHAVWDTVWDAILDCHERESSGRGVEGLLEQQVWNDPRPDAQPAAGSEVVVPATTGSVLVLGMIAALGAGLVTLRRKFL